MQSQVIILCGFVSTFLMNFCLCLFVCYMSVPVCFCHNAVQYKPHANPSSLSFQQLSSTLNLKCKDWFLHFKQIMVFTWNQTQADTKQTVDPECVLMVQDACNVTETFLVRIQTWTFIAHHPHPPFSQPAFTVCFHCLSRAEMKKGVL